jgi:hypothetical protein
MRTLLSLTLAGLVAVAGMGVAHAADIRGRIETVDTENNTIRLKNGVELHYGDDVNEADLVVGASVKAKYESVKGYFQVTKLTVSKKD